MFTKLKFAPITGAAEPLPFSNNPPMSVPPLLRKRRVPPAAIFAVVFNANRSVMPEGASVPLVTEMTEPLLELANVFVNKLAGTVGMKPAPGSYTTKSAFEFVVELKATTYGAKMPAPEVSVPEPERLFIWVYPTVPAATPKMVVASRRTSELFVLPKEAPEPGTSISAPCEERVSVVAVNCVSEPPCASRRRVAPPAMVTVGIVIVAPAP